MSQLLVIALIVVVAIVLIAIAVVIARKVGQTRLRPLPDESRDRYARMWPSKNLARQCRRPTRSWS